MLGHLPGAQIPMRLKQIGEWARHHRASDHAHVKGISRIWVPHTADQARRRWLAYIKDQHTGGASPNVDHLSRDS